jgi:uncharacterized OB-fold protein
MTGPTRPMPDVDEPDTAMFWKAAQEHRLLYQVCLTCKAVVFYPRAHCPKCGSDEIEYRPSGGLGTIYSFTVIRQTPDPAFRAAVPFVVAYVDMAEGFRIISHVRADPGSVRIGGQVTLAWDSIDGSELPVFLPAA